ncbi:MAG: dephospho-CoA kinase [Bacteroidia bacterium]
MIVGLTGGIGSGKSVVAKVFETLGAKIFNSDNKAKEAYADPYIKRKVIDLLGEKSYKNGKLNKSHISEVIFSDEELRLKLNGIIHPFVGDAFKSFVEKNRNSLVIKESALLVELKLHNELDKLIVVTSPLSLRIERIMKRDGLSKEAVINKINAQSTDEQKSTVADYVIINDEEQAIIPQVLKIYQELTDV